MSADTDAPDCQLRECDRPAVAMYQGTTPPAGTFRFLACREHSPPDAPPLETFDVDDDDQDDLVNPDQLSTVDENDQDDAYHEPDRVECSVCGALVGRGPAGLGTKQHSARHRREFHEKFGRPPADYDEVRDVLGPVLSVNIGDQLTLVESADERARRARLRDDQAELGGPE